MKGSTPFRIFLVLSMALLASDILSAISSAAEDDAVWMGQFRELTDLRDPETGNFTGLSVGDLVFVRDEVAQVKLDPGTHDTLVWLLSTGDSLLSENLVFVGDRTEEISQGDKIELKISLTEGSAENGTGHVLKYGFSDLEFIDGKDDKEGDKDEIELFGLKFEQQVLPEEVRTPLGRFVLVFIAWSICTVLLWGVFWVVLKISTKTRTDIDHKIVRIVRGPFFVIILLYGLLVSLSQLDLPRTVIDLLDMLYRGGTIILVSYIAIKVMKQVVFVYLRLVSQKTETQADDVLVPVAAKVVTVVIWIIGGIMFLKAFGVDVTVFLAGMGIIGLVIAFAAQDTLSNFFAGIMILLDRPFKEGDFIILNDSVYEVKDIGLRSTRLFHTFSNQVVTIPNNKISDHMFSNLTEPNVLGRRTVEVGVSYDSNPRKIGQILLDIIKEHPDTLEDEDHQTLYRFNAFGDSSLQFSVTFWVRDYNDQWRVASEIRERIYDVFEKEGVEIPFPQRVIHHAANKNAVGSLARNEIGTSENAPPPSSGTQNLSP